MSGIFPTFYDYFLFTKSWAYVLMFLILPGYVCYWLCILNGKKPKEVVQEFLADDGKDSH